MRKLGGVFGGMTVIILLLLCIVCHSDAEKKPCARSKLSQELLHIWSQVAELEKEMKDLTQVELTDKCRCDCNMSGVKGQKGGSGGPGYMGPKGLKGRQGNAGEKGKRYRGPPVEPKYYYYPEFINKLKNRWKGYNGPWGRKGDIGQQGRKITCDCDHIRSSCSEWCRPLKGEKGAMGATGNMGISGVPGIKGIKGPPIQGPP